MMIMYNLMIIFIMFIVGNLIFISKNKHLLIILLSLEFIVLGIFFLLMLLSFKEYDMYMLMIFLVFIVCEGALGLSILVSMIRTYGNDYFQSFNLL